MEAPEKIYIYRAGEDYEEEWGNKPWGEDYVEYTRTDVFIEKTVEIAREEMVERACEYLDGLIELLNTHGYGIKKKRVISGLKQAMKE